VGEYVEVGEYVDVGEYVEVEDVYVSVDVLEYEVPVVL